ncbi:MAG TPA: hypothetical protein PLT47_05585 [Bacteroidales bacterium]|nr:hypothetical protein [Bacteroidales bacterium]
MKIRIITLLLIVASLGCSSQTNEAPKKFFKATVNNVTLDVPEGFEAVTGQNGFLHKGSASTLMIEEIPNSPYSFSAEHFNATNLEKDGAKLTGSDKIKTSSGHEAILYTLTVPLKSKDNTTTADFERMVLLTGNETRTICIVVNYPVIIKKLIQEPLKTSMLSIIIN